MKNKIKHGSWITIWTSLIALIVIFCFPMSTGAIQNGQPDENDHPYVCMVVFYDACYTPLWRTTGVLVSPDVVVTAGHGTYGTSYASVWFESDINPNNSTSLPFDITGYPLYEAGTSYTGVPSTHPDYRADQPANNGLPGFDYHDVGVVVLDTPTSFTQFGSLPAAGIVDTLPMMNSVDLVGYGVNFQVRGGGTSPYNAWRSLYMRYYAPAAVVQCKGRISSEFIKLTANPGNGKGGTTFGDSGGPILNGGTNVILAVNSFVTNANCDGVTYAQRIDIPDILSWINGFTD